MSPITWIIHRLVIASKAEEFFVNLRRRANIIRQFLPVRIRHGFTSFGRFIPNSTEYSKNDCYPLTRNNTKFVINRSDYVQWRLFYGVRDNALKEAKKYLESGSIVLDIGASFGAFSLNLATFINENKYSKIEIYAFEPNPVAYENYKGNLDLNPCLRSIIHLHPIGLGDENGPRPFHYFESNTGAGRVVAESVATSTVQIQRLDDFVHEINPEKIAFIKLIVEGFEPKVFKGGWKTIKKYKPPIFFEVTRSWWEENNSSVENTLALLKGEGYHFTIEHFNEMLPYESSKYASRFQFNLMGVVG